MKKFPLLGVSIAFAAVLASGPAQAYTVGFDFQGSLAVLGSSGAIVGTDPSMTGNIGWNYETGTGTASFVNSNFFFGYDWNFHDITLTATQTGVAHADMLLDWAGNQNIHVMADFGMTPYYGDFGGGYDLITLDGDQDGIAGNVMGDGVFQYMSITLSGKVSGGCPIVEPEYCDYP